MGGGTQGRTDGSIQRHPSCVLPFLKSPGRSLLYLEEAEKKSNITACCSLPAVGVEESAAT